MKKTLILAFSISLAVIAGGALIWSKVVKQVQIVQTTSLRLAPLESSIDTNGRVEADKVYELHAPVSGSCRQIMVREGAVMKAGEPILEIDAPALQSELADARVELEAAQVDLRNIKRGPPPEEINQAEADEARYRLELNNAKKSLEANEWLLERQAVPRVEVEQNRRQVELLQQSLAAAATRKDDLEKRYGDADRQRALLRVEAAKSKIKYLEGNAARLVIRAPIDGSLYQFNMRSGAYVNAGDLVGLLADLSRLRVRAYVDEPDLGRVSPRAEVEISWDAHPGQLWKGAVRYVPPEVIEYRSRSVAEVLCSLESPAGLVPNVNVNVEIVLPQGPRVLSLPRDTIFPAEKGYFVWLVRGGRTVRQPMQTGRSTLTRIEVTGGISQEDKVIIPGEVSIREGMRVQISGE